MINVVCIIGGCLLLLPIFSLNSSFLGAGGFFFKDLLGFLSMMVVDSRDSRMGMDDGER